MTTPTALLRKAAAIIREHAQELRTSYCTPPVYDLATMEPEVREVYDDEVETAAALESAAAEQKSRADLYPELVEALETIIRADDDQELTDEIIGKGRMILAKCKEQS